MAIEDIVALVITCSIGAVVVVISAELLSGRGAGVIAGFNTLPAEEKEKYDRAALCRFIGAVMLPIGLLFPCIAVGPMYGLWQLPVAFAAVTVGVVVFAVVYCNTGDRFKKK